MRVLRLPSTVLTKLNCGNSARLASAHDDGQECAQPHHFGKARQTVASHIAAGRKPVDARPRR